jgi:hypothetical protein
MSRHTGFASLPLHSGRAPAWLFSRMKLLSREIIVYLTTEYGAADVLRRLSDPHWFQALGCVLGFDWHSSGVTTTVCGAIKEGIRDVGSDVGLFVVGGKGATSRKSPAEILEACDRIGRDPAPLVYASKTAAKVDSAAVQDGYQLYHHAFFFTRAGDWCVVQQGMSDASRTARRYHWLSDHVESFVNEPHEAVCCDARGAALNLVAHESAGVRDGSVAIANEAPATVLREMARVPELRMPARHTLVPELDVANSRMGRILERTYERAPADFETLLGIPGVGAKTLRALSLLSEVMHGTSASMRDPARFSFAHGGKDGTPFPVDRATYDATIAVFGSAINRAGIDRSEKVAAFRRLAKWGAPAT